jgi:phosphopantothenoylcysteine decarboxylase/phosphopantothenate--cysteine ligase
VINADEKTVVIGVCGGIAIYKMLDVISTLRKNNVNVHVIMTENATKFVTPVTFQAISQNLVTVDMFDEPKAWEIQHISLAKKADLVVVAPATANIIGKVANGIGDDMLSTTIMATKAPVIFAPAMNTNMYENPIVSQNVEKLKSFGYKFIETQSGRLACGDTGSGKLAETRVISDTILSALYPIKDMEGMKVLVTAGPTISPIDPVRYISNRSSGKMGYAIAEEARDRGAEVILISGPTSLQKPVNTEIINVNTNEEMLSSVSEHYADCDIVIKCAAVADYKAKDYSEKKIKKRDEELTLEFVKDTDILKKLGEQKSKQILVGFAAESNDLIINAKEKLNKKNLDYIVANDITSEDSGFSVDDNRVTILCKDGETISLDKMPKRHVAKQLFDLIIKKR